MGDRAPGQGFPFLTCQCQRRAQRLGQCIRVAWRHQPAGFAGDDCFAGSAVIAGYHRAAHRVGLGGDAAECFRVG